MNNADFGASVHTIIAKGLEEIWQLNKHNRLVVMLVTLAVTTFAQTQNLIKDATAPVSFSKSDFADTMFPVSEWISEQLIREE